jgi:sec-independent protein translocase protein TatA
MLAEIIGPDMLIILAIVLVLFGGKQLPNLARSLGSAKREFEKGMHGHDDAADADDDDDEKAADDKTVAADDAAKNASDHS